MSSSSPCQHQALSVWSNNGAVPNANANTFSSDESDSDGDSAASAGEASTNEANYFGPRSVYRNSLRLSRKWVRKAVAAGRQSSAPQFAALATSPCGCMFAASCEGSSELTVWLRRRNMPAQGKPWEMGFGNGGGIFSAGATAAVEPRGDGPWSFQPATVLAHDRPLVQVVWGRGSGAQQDYLLTLGEDGRCGGYLGMARCVA